MTQSQFIQRLKKQPRLGMGFMDDLEDAAGSAWDSLKELIKGTPEIAKAMGMQATAFAKANTSLIGFATGAKGAAAAHGNFLAGLERQVAFNQEFSKSWDLQDSSPDFEPLTDDPVESNDENKYRTVNTSDEERIFHTYDKWECYKAGFYNTTHPKLTKKQCEEAYRDFLSNTKWLSETLEKIIMEWKYSCEQYLTNKAMNRIAWLGQAAACYSTGMPAECRGGFSLMDPEDQIAANELALKYLNKWLQDNGRDTVTMDEAMPSRQSEIY